MDIKKTMVFPSPWSAASESSRNKQGSSKLMLPLLHRLRSNGELVAKRLPITAGGTNSPQPGVRMQGSFLSFELWLVPDPEFWVSWDNVTTVSTAETSVMECRAALLQSEVL